MHRAKAKSRSIATVDRLQLPGDRFNHPGETGSTTQQRPVQPSSDPLWIRGLPQRHNGLPSGHGFCTSWLGPATKLK
jgi:hypothetical protein